jgi:hypothetical protein
LNAEIKISDGDIFMRLLTAKKWRWLRHSVGVLLIVMLVSASFVEQQYASPYNVISKVVSGGSLVAFFYANMYFLIPRFVYRGHTMWYVFWLLVMFIVGFGLETLFLYTIIEPHRIVPKKEVFGVVGDFALTVGLFLFLTLPSTALKIFQRWATGEQRLGELERRALESELTALRNQVNPHFLFNMLNNVNVLIGKNPQKASLIILKLSDFLRYQLYQSSAAEVFLLEEVRFLTDMLNIEHIRRDDFVFTVEYDAGVLKGVRVPPMIFINFVENAVKYSADSTGASNISIAFHLERGMLQFSCVNSKGVQSIRNDAAGLGLANVKRRLELLYGHRFELEMEDVDSRYRVTLRIPL